MKIRSHPGHLDQMAATLPSQAPAGAAHQAPDLGQWEGQDASLVRPYSCFVKGKNPRLPKIPTYVPLSPPSTKEGPYQDRPPLCPCRLLPLLIYSGLTIAFLKFQGPKSKNIENKILLQP